MGQVERVLIMEGQTTTNAIKTFVDGVVGGVTGAVTLADIATVIAAIIGAGIVAIFAWKFARKGYAFVKNALSGRGGKI